ncbi:MAG: hypothetical protein AAGJ81_05880 [Verrucomicrobiota bacterium]
MQENEALDELQTTRKKPIYPVKEGLRSYLAKHGRERRLPVTYEELLDYSVSVPLRDSAGKDTLWETVAYPQPDMQRISKALTQIYGILKTDGEWSAVDNLYMDRIDFCTFGNSHPFRIRIVNVHNDNQDYYYIKKADASRVYGLELEHLLSPNRMHYLTYGQTLVEEHVIGIPGDAFIRDWLDNPQISRIRLAKELVKFNERCFLRLLGDMRSYNFVVDITPDFEGFQLRIRPMDFDQQSYQGRKHAYLPQFFKSNNELVFFCLNNLIKETAYQYQLEEHAMMTRRINLIHKRLRMLLAEMSDDTISEQENVEQLRAELADHHERKAFLKANSMGGIVRESLHTILDHSAIPADKSSPLRLDIDEVQDSE